MVARSMLWISTLVLFAATALADIVGDPRGPCDDRAAGAACIQSDGRPGVCQRNEASGQLECRPRRVHRAPDAGHR